MKNHSECKEDEIFVGNTKKGRDLSHLYEIKHRIGSQAYTITGEKISQEYMLPLFVCKSDFYEYEKIMTERARNARLGI